MELIDKAAVIAEIKRVLNSYDPNEITSGVYALVDLRDFIDTLEVKEINEKSETTYRSIIIKVKCISPYDETWEKGKVYICEKWHHGDLNMDFWDVYYDYDNNTKYVQFSSIEMLEKEFAIARNDTIEVEEVDLDKEISEYFVEHSDEFFSDKYKLIAKHFYELGLKAKKGE